MTDTVALKPCPMCSKPLEISGGVNPYGRCITDGCWMMEAKLSVVCDDPKQVERWNTRATLSAQPAQLPQDVINLVIAAREMVYEDFDPKKMKALDTSLEVFGDRVPWGNEPDATDEELYQMACDLHEDSVNGNLLSAHPHPTETVQEEAWLHTLHTEMGPTEVEVSTSSHHPFGKAGQDYDKTYIVTSKPLGDIGALVAQRDEWIALYHEGGTWKEQLSKAERRSEKAKAAQQSWKRENASLKYRLDEMTVDRDRLQAALAACQREK